MHEVFRDIVRPVAYLLIVVAQCGQSVRFFLRPSCDERTGIGLFSEFLLEFFRFFPNLGLIGLSISGIERLNVDVNDLFLLRFGQSVESRIVPHGLFDRSPHLPGVSPFGKDQLRCFPPLEQKQIRQPVVLRSFLHPGLDAAPRRLLHRLRYGSDIFSGSGLSLLSETFFHLRIDRRPGIGRPGAGIASGSFVYQGGGHHQRDLSEMVVRLPVDVDHGHRRVGHSSLSDRLEQVFSRYIVHPDQRPVAGCVGFSAAAVSDVVGYSFPCR